MRRTTDDDGESGQITLLSIGFGLLALTLVLVLAAASSLYLERKQLLALADGAAADAADAIDYERYYAPDGPAEGLPLSDASVRESVVEYLGSSAAATTFRGLGVSAGTGTEDGRTARVVLSAVARPAVVPWVLVPWTDGFVITVTSSARAD
ncbi:pilus assembly protein TadG-related protein [Georgenia wutianyii]|uniref:pilus assembly protein TadG-related protein n=1 Tax=Georgenia wutianyii TaxID=2585135 RepID=UPI001E2C1E4A|nr:pilus assembly protein TadG-related protein [Georgenia wutianyii]